MRKGHFLGFLYYHDKNQKLRDLATIYPNAKICGFHWTFCSTASAIHQVTFLFTNSLICLTISFRKLSSKNEGNSLSLTIILTNPLSPKINMCSNWSQPSYRSKTIQNQSPNKKKHQATLSHGGNVSGRWSSKRVFDRGVRCFFSFRLLQW